MPFATVDYGFKVLNFFALTWCRRHSLNHTIVFIVFLFPVVMEFYCVLDTK